MQCLRLLSHDCYPQLGRSAIRKALEAGQRYQKLLSSHSPLIPISIEIRGPCENGLHLAELHLALGEDQAAEDLLRQLTAPTFDPPLELDLWLIRTKVARHLAAAKSDPELDRHWKAAVINRWKRVEDSTRTILRQIAQDPPRLRKLAAHYRPDVAGPQQLNVAIASLRENLLEQAANGGPNAVLMLARITAHEDQLPRVQRLTEELLEYSQASATKNPVFIGQLHSQIGALEATLGQLEAAQDHYQQCSTR